MPKLISAGTSEAPYKLSQSEVKEFTQNLFGGRYDEIERLISVFDNSSISKRHISVPMDWLSANHSFKERNEIFRDTAVELSQKALEVALSDAGAHIDDINNIIFVTSTGLSTPTVDAILFNRLKLGNHIKRTPLWGLGCAGGASAVSKAMDYCKANPAHNTVVIAVELCSLTFQKDDLSKSNIIAASLFSDGCAAALVCGDESPLNTKKGIELLGSMSTIYEDSLDVMGWDIIEDGFKVLFSRDIPTIVRENVKPNIQEFLNQYNLAIDDIKHYIAHPGGAKVIEAYTESLGLMNGKLDHSKTVLHEHGNMSSPTVLYVLKEFFKKGFKAGEYGLLTALGPGFSSELVLFKTTA